MTPALILWLLLLYATRQQWRKVSADERAMCALCGERHEMLYRNDIHASAPAWCCWHCTKLMTHRGSYV